MTFDNFKSLPGGPFYLFACAMAGTPALCDTITANENQKPAKPTIEEVTTTATRVPKTVNQQGSNIAVLSRDFLEQQAHTHISESFYQVPGGWISRGNGQEHLTAVRSPVFTGAGACGEFLMAEDGIPLRAAGFCNVNQLFDANSEQAGRIEVIRGPGSALYGSNSLHGIINIISRAPSEEPETDFSLEGGPHNYSRLKFSSSQLGGNHRFRVSANATHDGGYKDDSGFDQHKVTLRHDYSTSSLSVKNGLTLTNLNQETAGFVVGHQAYNNSALKKHNPNPEAYRDSRSARMYSSWQWSSENGIRYLVTPYVRWTDMAFLQHYLPWKSLEENGHASVGVQTGIYLNPWLDNLELITGIDLEYTQGWLKETQSQPFSATLPQGVHYDYSVNAAVLAPYSQLTWQARPDTSVTFGLRYEYTGYDYNNHTSDGDACNIGVTNCRFSRPGDRSDNFSAWSPKLSVLHQLNDKQSFYLNLSQSYRAPQATELYRLQNGQRVTDLDVEQLDSVELGFRGQLDNTRLALALFAMDKDHFIFQDTERQIISNGESDHRGIEWELAQIVTPRLTARVSGSYARHRYANDTAISNTAIGGNDIDTAPRHISQAALEWRYADNALATLEGIYMGRYYLNPENTASYNGHTLVNLRVTQPLSVRWQLGVRITNLLNVDYAERADFAFGSERYFVGEPRSVYFSIKGHF